MINAYTSVKFIVCITFINVSSAKKKWYMGDKGGIGWDTGNTGYLHRGTHGGIQGHSMVYEWYKGDTGWYTGGHMVLHWETQSGTLGTKGGT